MTKLMLAAAAAAALFAGPALAAGAGADTDTVRSAVLHTGQVNYQDAAQVRAVYKQIRSVARSVCSEPSIDGVFAPSGPDRECMRQAEAQAVSKINRQTLTAAFEGEHGPASLNAGHALANNDQ